MRHLLGGYRPSLARAQRDRPVVASAGTASATPRMSRSCRAAKNGSSGGHQATPRAAPSAGGTSAGTLADRPRPRPTPAIDVRRRVGGRQAPGKVQRRSPAGSTGPPGSDPAAVAAVSAERVADVRTQYAPDLRTHRPAARASALSGRGQAACSPPIAPPRSVADPNNVLAARGRGRRDELRRDPNVAARPRLAAAPGSPHAAVLAAGTASISRCSALCTAGRPRGGTLRARGHASRSHSMSASSNRCRLRASPPSSRSPTSSAGPAGLLEDRVCAPLRDAFPAARIEIDPHRTPRAGYYVGAAFRVAVSGGRRDGDRGRRDHRLDADLARRPHGAPT